MLHHFLFWVLKWFVTILAFGSLVNVFKTVNRPLATRSIVVGHRRIRKTQLDNLMDGAASIYGFAFFVSMAALLWLS